MTTSHPNTTGKTAQLYRMVMPKHNCPYGKKSYYFLQKHGFSIEDHHLTNRDEVDQFKQEHNVKTTPQIFIEGERIGGYDALREYLGYKTPKAGETSYTPVIALFSMTALLAIAVSVAAWGELRIEPTIMWFISFSMVVLALLKLQDVERFSTMFLNYDLLAQKWVPYGYIYPFAEGAAGLLMSAHLLNIISIPMALLIGGIGAVSVFKAVYIDKRELKCACVGGNSNVPLGFVSLTENVMMVGMALWMSFRAF